MGEINKRVSEGVNKLLIENKCDPTSPEEAVHSRSGGARRFTAPETCDMSETCDTSETTLRTRCAQDLAEGESV